MQHVRATVARIIVLAMLVGASLVPAASPASAHGRLPKGKYPCFHYVSGSVLYTSFDLYIKAKRRYVFKQGDERVGRAGRLRHPSGNDRIRFRTGYLAKNGFKGLHQRRPGSHTVRLAYETSNGGTAYYYCSN